MGSYVDHRQKTASRTKLHNPITLKMTTQLFATENLKSYMEMFFNCCHSFTKFPLYVGNIAFSVCKWHEDSSDNIIF